MAYVVPHGPELQVPDGWAARRSVEVAAADRRGHVVVTVEPAGSSTTAELAAGYGELMSTLANYRSSEPRAVSLFGARDALLRRCSFDRDEGPPVTQLIAYLVEDGLAYVVTATATSERFGSVEADLLAILTSIDLPASAATGSRPTLGRATADVADRPVSWAGPRRAWQEPGAEPAGVGHDLGHDGAPVELSAEELTALATAVGADSFPYLRDRDRAEVAGPGRPAALRAAARSLLARGLFVVDGATIRPGDGLGRRCASAIVPDLLVSVEVDDGPAPVCTVLAGDADEMVSIGPGRDGLYTFGAVPAASLVDRIVGLVRRADQAVAAAPVEEGVVTAEGFEEARNLIRVGDPGRAKELLEGVPGLFELLADGGLRRVRSLHRSSHGIRGGELMWAVGASGTAVISADRDRASVTPASWDDVRARLLDLLPD